MVKESREKVYAYPNLVTPNKPIAFDEDTCIACNRCVDMCQMDVFMPNPAPGKPPPGAIAGLPVA